MQYLVLLTLSTSDRSEKLQHMECFKITRQNYFSFPLRPYKVIYEGIMNDPRMESVFRSSLSPC